MSRPKNRKSEPSAPARVVLYIRVSTEQQADKGNSLEAQQSRLEGYAAAFGLEVVGIEVDAGFSAGSIDRPGLQRALARLDAFEANVLLVAKLDRLTRSLGDLAALIDTYFRDGQNHLMSVAESINTTTAAGRVVLNILTCISQWELEAAAERTATVMQHMRDTGKYTGGHPPYGFELDEDGNLIECPPEQVMLQRAKELRDAGHTLRAIACHLGTNRRTGKSFNATQIVRML